MSIDPISLALMVGVGLKVASDIQTARSQAEGLEFKAQQIDREKQKTEREKRQMLSRQRALYAKSGVVISEGSPLEVMADTATQFEMDIRLLGRGARIQRRQVKAVKRGLRIKEVPVDYRKRIGQSKISGTISGTFRAGAKIIFTIFKYRFAKD